MVSGRRGVRAKVRLRGPRGWVRALMSELRGAWSERRGSCRGGRGAMSEERGLAPTVAVG